MSAGSSPPPAPPFLRRLLWGFLVAVLLAVAFTALWLVPRYGVTPRSESLPALTTVPEFSLTAADGSTMTRESLTGGPWIADLIFTRCAVSCPVMSGLMAQLQDELPAPMSFVSLSVDPAYDTPEVLASYAERFGAGERWHFLTGPREDLEALIKQGLLLGFDDNPPPEMVDPDEPIVHSTRFLLVDAEGRVRGYYDPFEEGALERLKRDAQGLL